MNGQELLGSLSSGAVIGNHSNNQNYREVKIALSRTKLMRIYRFKLKTIIYQPKFDKFIVSVRR